MRVTVSTIPRSSVFTLRLLFMGSGARCRGWQATSFYRSLFSCSLIGLENIPVAELKSGRPLLFVSNHPIMGFDCPILLSELYNQASALERCLQAQARASACPHDTGIHTSHTRVGSPA